MEHVGRHFTEIARTAATVFSILLTRSGIVRSRALRHPCLPGRGIVDGALSKEEALVGYCEDGDLEIDNNRAERSLRGIALFAAKRRTSAVLNGLLTICKRLHIDLFASNGLARSASFPANGRPSPERARQTAPGQNGRQPDHGCSDPKRPTLWTVSEEHRFRTDIRNRYCRKGAQYVALTRADLGIL